MSRIVERLLSGVPVRDAVLEARDYFRNNLDYEKISSEAEFLGFNGTLAAYTDRLKKIDQTPEYTVYSFSVYCPDLIGTVYDADNPHPLEVTLYLPASVDPNETGFVDTLARSYKTGEEIRDALKFLSAPGETVFKPMQFKPLWEARYYYSYDPTAIDPPDDPDWDKYVEIISDYVREFEDIQKQYVDACSSLESFYKYCETYSVSVADPEIVKYSGDYYFMLSNDDIMFYYDEASSNVARVGREDGLDFSIRDYLSSPYNKTTCWLDFTDDADIESCVAQAQELVNHSAKTPSENITVLFDNLLKIPGIKDLEFEPDFD